MATAARHRPATIADYLEHPEGERLELIRGSLLPKVGTAPGHSDAQLGTGMTLGTHFQRGRGGPGGWRFFTELAVQLGDEVFAPDVCGYRRERMPERSRERPVRLVPDWVCEILSPSNVSRDRVEKRETYFRSGVAHYWIIDPGESTLEVFRRTDIGYALVLAAHSGQRVRAEPFDEVEIAVDELLGVDAATT